MSKKELQELNENLVQHFKETGVKNALYYEPLFDYYWEQKDKIGLCNLESYDKEIQGIQRHPHRHCGRVSERTQKPQEHYIGDV